MRRIRNLGQSLWHKPLCRLLSAGVFAAVLGVAAAHAFLGSVAVVSGTSMLPTFEPGACVYTSPISTSLERGDIVLIDDGNKECAIKRIVGLPGEAVHIKHGYIFINRRMLLEPYLPKRVYTFSTKPQRAFLLEEDEYFVLGDNRPNSSDSRNYGPVDRKQIKRRIPLPEGAVRAHFSEHLLPTCEAVLPRRTVQKVEGS